MDSHAVLFAKSFLTSASLRDTKRIYRTLALTHHPDRGGTDQAFQQLEHIYHHACKGRKGLSQLRHWLPKKLELKTQTNIPHADKLGVFRRNGESVHDKPVYVNRDDPNVAIWWAPPDVGYPFGLWVIGLYDKRGQDDAYHIRSALKSCLEKEENSVWESFSPTSGHFEKTYVTVTVSNA